MLNQNTASQSPVATPSKSKNSQIKLIREAYSAIPDMQDGFKDVREYLFDLNERAERQHRKGAPYAAWVGHGRGTVVVLADAYLSAYFDRYPDQGTVYGVPGRHHNQLPDNSLTSLKPSNIARTSAFE